ncbi:hypothetical protein J6590_023907 [Homalodisca vitripennis]|nr:hypothetical protein J6590_023907 [Homalodisca vitripennis]
MENTLIGCSESPLPGTIEILVKFEAFDDIYFALFSINRDTISSRSVLHSRTYNQSVGTPR